jgi:hypothetical protein
MKIIRYFYLLVLIITCPIISLSQTGFPVSSFGSTNLDFGSDIIIGHNENIIVCGQSSGYPSGITSGMLASLNGSGILQKQVLITDSFDFIRYNKAQKTDTGYIFLGMKQNLSPPYIPHISVLFTDYDLNMVSELLIPLNIIGFLDFLIARFDSQGNALFHGMGYPTTTNSLQPCIVKIDPHGNILHESIGPFTGFDYGFNVALMEDFHSRGYYLADQQLSGGQYILLLDTSLNLLLDTIRLPSELYMVSQLQKFDTDQILIKSRGKNYGMYYLTYIDTLGNLEFQKELGKTGKYNMFNTKTMDVTPSAMFVASSYLDDILDVYFPDSTNSISVIKLDTAFNTVWSIEIGWDAHFLVKAILATPDGGCIVLASVYDSDTMYMRHDVVLFKLDGNGQLVGVTNLTPEPDDLVVFPNPGTDRFEIKGADPLERVEVYDASGRLVRNVNLKGHPAIVDMHDAPSGLYIIRATSTTGKSYRPVKWVKR